MNLSRQSFTVRAVAVDEEQVNTVGDRSQGDDQEYN